MSSNIMSNNDMQMGGSFGQTVENLRLLWRYVRYVAKEGTNTMNACNNKHQMAVKLAKYLSEDSELGALFNAAINFNQK